jgi:hypothetical protein
MGHEGLSTTPSLDHCALSHSRWEIIKRREILAYKAGNLQSSTRLLTIGPA